DKLLMEDMNFSLPPNGIVGVIGPNGAGKTTLFRMIIGDEQPDAGEFHIGPSVKLAYVEQSRDALGTEQSVYDAIAGGADTFKAGNVTVNTRAYVTRFGFIGTDQSRPVGTLSGG